MFEEIYSFYGLSHWLSEVDDLLAQIDQVSIATPKPQASRSKVLVD